MLGGSRETRAISRKEHSVPFSPRISSKPNARASDLTLVVSDLGTRMAFKVAGLVPHRGIKFHFGHHTISIPDLSSQRVSHTGD